MPNFYNGDASTLSYNQGASGATTRSQQAKNQESVSVADFPGADPTGATSSSAAFNAAVAAVVAAGGGKIFVPPGKWLLSTTVQIAANGVWLDGAGAGPGGALILNGQTNAPAIQFGDGTNTYARCACTNMLFAANTGITSVAGSCGLKVIKNNNFYANRFELFNFPAALYNGIVLNTVSQSFFSNIGNQSQLSDGIQLILGNDTYFSNCRSDSNGGNGWVIQDSAGNYMNACSAYNNSSSAWSINTAGSNGNVDHFYVNCVGDTSGSYNWSVTQLIVGNFVSCWGSTQQSATVNTFATGFIFSGANVKSIQLSACYAEYNNSHGILIDSNIVDISLEGCNFGGQDSSHGNGRAAGGGSGILITSSATDVKVHGGRARFNATYGISITGATTRCRIDNVDLNGNTTAALQNPGNATRISGCQSFNPQMGAVSQPAVAASGTAVTNNSGVDCMVYIVGGTVSGINVGGSGVLLATPAMVLVPAGQTITLTYSSAPSWQWSGL